MAEEQDRENQAGLGRRQFLRSIFGLGSVAETLPPAESKPGTVSSKIYWANLRNGQMGFPCGHFVPKGMPGSIMKLVAAAALTDARIILPDEKFECRGVYKLNHETYKCQQAHGVVDLVHALGMSCNVYFAHASQKLSGQVILEYARKFGLAEGVADFGKGLFPALNSHEPSVKYILGLSQDLQPNALQILRVAALVANKGRLPYLHSAEQPVADAQPFELNLSEQAWHVLQQGMQIASREGTGKKLDPENKLHLAIKTGTTPHGNSFQSWICGYFPWQDPRYAFVLRAQSGTSQDEAVPQARAFLFSVDWP